MTFQRIAAALCLLSGLAGFATSASADQLQDVKARKELLCGVYADVQPFSYPDPKTRGLVGMDVDLCNAIAKEMGVAATLKPLSVEARIPELKLGRVDLVVANLAYTKSRAEQIQFSNAYYMTKEVLLVKKADAGKSLKSLEGQRMSSTKGSTSEQAIRVRNGTPVTFQDTGSAFLALQQGKVVGFVTNNMTALNYVRQTKGTADELAIVPEQMVDEPIAAGLRQGEPAFAAEVNKALVAIEKSGELNRIWDKWLGPNTLYGIVRTDKVAPISELKFVALN